MTIMQEIEKYIEMRMVGSTCNGRVYVPDRKTWLEFSFRHDTKNPDLYHEMSICGGLIPNFMLPMLGSGGYNRNNMIRFLREGGINVKPWKECHISIRSGDFEKMVDYLNTKWMEKHGLMKPEETIVTSKPHRLAGHVKLEFE